MSVLSGTAAAGATYFGASKSAEAQKEASSIAWQMYQDAVRRNQPFYDVSTKAIPEYESMLGLPGSKPYDMKQSPAAQWQLEQGTKALNRAMASRGLSGSGNAINRLTELNKSIAASDWNQQYSRILDALKLGTGASASMGAASNTETQAAQQGAQNLGNIYQNLGNTQASLYTGASGSALNALATAVKGYDAYNKYNAGTTGEVATNNPSMWDDVTMVGAM